MVGVLLIVLLKYLCVSGVLLGIYVLLFKNKASFLSQRIYLLLCPVIAILAATVSIDAIKVNKDNAIGQVILRSQEVSHEAAVEEAVDYSFEGLVIENGGIFIDMMTILLAIWAGISIYLVVRYIINVRYVLSLRKMSTKEQVEGYTLCRSGIIETPFSFYKSIFVSRLLNDEKFDLVLKHELAHIKNYHYLDKLISQTYLVLSWFNPIVWKIHKELEIIHEFQADYDVINSNCDKQRYKQFLFDEVSYNFPTVANGFNGSLIKQRFIQMKNNYKLRYTAVRKLLTVPAIILVLLLTSFTYVNEEAVKEKTTQIAANAEKSINDLISDTNNVSAVVEDVRVPDIRVPDIRVPDVPVADVVVDDVVDDVVITADHVIVADARVEDVRIEDVRVADVREVPSQTATKTEGVNTETTNKDLPQQKKATVEVSKSSVDPEEKHNYYYMNDNQFYYAIVKDMRTANRLVNERARVYRKSNYTEVDIINRLYDSFRWMSLSKNTYLEDLDTGVRYKIHSIKNNVPLSRNLAFKGKKSGVIYYTCIFPPLPRSVKYVKLVEEKDPERSEPVPSNGSGNYNFLKLKVYNDVEKEYYASSTEVIELDPNFSVD
ncbi:MAG: M56 family metallopeptidase [Rikenellaceae bacterium]